MKMDIRQQTIIYWHGKGLYQFWPGGAYDEIEYPAEIRRTDHFCTGRYCKSVRDVVKAFGLRQWETIHPLR